jgi:hypothetical protein
MSSSRYGKGRQLQTRTINEAVDSYVHLKEAPLVLHPIESMGGSLFKGQNEEPL